MEPLMQLLSAFFDQARFRSTEQYGASAFCGSRRSPALACAKRIISLLRDAESPSWGPLRAQGGWDEQK
eukprot:3613259-Alexandrium_andersonii.AAC.1